MFLKSDYQCGAMLSSGIPRVTRLQRLETTEVEVGEGQLGLCFLPSFFGNRSIAELVLSLIYVFEW